MGLDTVELIIDVEQHFGVRLPNSDLAEIRTVGHLRDLVLRELPNRPEPTVCFTSRVFYKVRRALVGMLGVPRKDILPSTQFGEIARPGAFHEFWQDLSASTELDLPWLSSWKRLHLAALVLATGATVAPLVIGWPGSMGILPLLVLASFVAYGLILRITAPVIWRFGFANKTVGDLVNATATLNRERLENQQREWQEQEAWEALCLIVESHAFVAKQDIRPDMSFADDLRLD